MARAWARERALEQALLLADLTQLAADSLPAGVMDGSEVRGLACCYTGLPFLAVALWSEEPEICAALLRALAAHQPRLRREPVYALVAEPICHQLKAVAEIEEVQEEIKRVLSPAGLTPATMAPARWEAVPLTARDLPALEALYGTVPAMAWGPKALDLGPFRGVYSGGELAAAAGTHFHTPQVSEIGHIVTRPEHRRQGMAEATIRAVAADLAGRSERIFLMHFDDNEAAGRLYERLGFLPYGRLYLTRFRLRSR